MTNEELYGLYLKLYAQVLTGHVVNLNDFGATSQSGTWQEYGNKGLLAIAQAVEHAKRRSLVSRREFIRELAENLE